MWQNSKTQNENPKRGQNSKTQKMTNLKNSQLDKRLKSKNVTKLRKHKIWQNSKNSNVTKLKHSQCEYFKNSKCDKRQKLKILQN